MKTLRDYQKSAVDATKNFTGTGGLIVAPTGSGKSLIIAEICKGTQKIVVMAHRAELIRQNAIEYQELTSEPVGIYSASVGQKSINRVTFAQIQSSYTIDFNADLIIVDEAHLVPKRDSSMYQRFLDKNKNATLLGLTATACRMDSGHLIQDEDSIFSKVIYDIKYNDLVSKGYLAKLIYKSPKGIDNNNLNVRGADLDLNLASEDLKPKLKKILEDALSKRVGKTLWFCPTVEMAHDVADAIGGIAVTGGIDRTDALEKFKTGEVQDLTNVDILTTGFNQPDIETIVFLRPTKSTGLFKQMLGRGTRLAPNKTSCIILDYTTNTECHGFLGDEFYYFRKTKSEDYKVCPICEGVVKITTKECDHCNYIWEVMPRETKSNILTSLNHVSYDPDQQYILELNYLRASTYYSQNSGKYSVKVDFNVTGGTFSKWIPEHGYYMRKFLGKLNTSPNAFKSNIDQINDAQKPERVLARKNGKYFEFVDFI